MLNKTTVKFLKEIKLNNHKDWLDKHRQLYLDAKADFEQFTLESIKALSKFDPTIAHLQAKDCTFRLNRDVRFSQNKAPYKSNMAWYACKGGKKSSFAGYYFHAEPGKSFLAGGIWMPMAPELKKIRQEIDYSWEEFEKIISQKTFKNTFGDLDKSEGNILLRPPKGYDENNPAIEYLKRKGFIVSIPIENKKLTQPGLVAELAGYCKTMVPFLQFLNRAVEEEG